MMGTTVLMSLVLLSTLTVIASAPAKLDDGKHIANIKQQVKDLQFLGCKPMLKKVRLTELLDPHDTLPDSILFFPQAVAVRRCIEDCSFCGNLGGTVTGVCLPVTKEEKTFSVAYIDHSLKRQHRQMSVEEHTECACQR